MDTPETIHEELSSFDPGAPGLTDDQALAYRAFCLQRLTRLLMVRAELEDGQGPELELQRRLVDHALYAGYRDCLSVGAEQEAKLALADAGHRTEARPR
jgi:hypothetical protein